MADAGGPGQFKEGHWIGAAGPDSPELGAAGGGIFRSVCSWRLGQGSQP